MTMRESNGLSRRAMLRGGALAAGGAFLVPLVPEWVLALQQAGATAEAAAKMRAQSGAAPIESLKLSDRLTMLSGPGGNVVVLNGPDGKVVVDTFVTTAWEKLKSTLDGLGTGKVTAVIDTHWHFDHADNNGNFRQLGAKVIAHENTSKRLAETHELLGMRFDPVPKESLPTETFATSHKLSANGDEILLTYIPPAHTDTDISIRFSRGNVLHLGDLFFNGIYPFIDASTGGTIDGMIRAADSILKGVDGGTKIVPGHGPLADRAALTRYRDMLVTVRDRVQKLKKAGRTLDEVNAAAPTKDLDPVWGKGFMPPAGFVAIVYNTLR